VTITFATPQHQFKLLWGTVNPNPGKDQVVFHFGGELALSLVPMLPPPSPRTVYRLPPTPMQLW